MCKNAVIGYLEDAYKNEETKLNNMLNTKNIDEAIVDVQLEIIDLINKLLDKTYKSLICCNNKWTGNEKEV